MRVLWFSNTKAVGLNKGVGCSWISSLESEIYKIPNIQLGIAFNCEDPSALSFPEVRTCYYPIKQSAKKNKFRKIIYRWKHEIDNKGQIEKYLDVIEQFKPDLIHIFGTESDFGLIIQKTTIPCIIHLQGILSVIDRKWYSAITSFDILKHSRKFVMLKGEGFYHEYISNKKASEREKTIFKNCKYFMGRTDWDRKITRILSPKATYFHCDEMIRHGFYQNQWKPQNSDSIYLISTFRSNIYKGFETILECKQLLKENFPDVEIVWTIAGIKPGDEISYLIQQKYEVELKDLHIHLLGSLTEDELINAMLKSDLFVHASHVENSPNSVCEAMLLGMPVIATYAGGTPSMIEDKKEGLLIQDGDPFALAGTIMELIANAEYANNLGLNARAKALKRHNPEKITNNLLEIYSVLLK